MTVVSATHWRETNRGESAYRSLARMRHQSLTHATNETSVLFSEQQTSGREAIECGLPGPKVDQVPIVIDYAIQSFYTLTLINNPVLNMCKIDTHI